MIMPNNNPLPEKPTIKEQPVSEVKTTDEKQIGKVVLLFDDGTFIDYTKK